MKNEMTKNQYELIIERLDYIKGEQANLEKIGLADSFEELLLNINRDNNKVDEKISKLLKVFLVETNIRDNQIKEKVKDTIGFLIMDLEANELTESLKEPVELVSICSHYPNFRLVYEKIKEEIERKKANNYLKDYIIKLCEEETSLQRQKFQYEKEQKGSKLKSLVLKIKNKKRL